MSQDKATDAINKRWGYGTIGTAYAEEVPTFSTGIAELDEITGIGGYPRGRIIEVYGPASGGKTTVALHAIASAQRAGGAVAFIDAEHALDTNYAKAVGVNLHKMLISQPDHGDQALEIAEILVSSGVVSLVVIDSVDALIPRAEFEGDIGEPYAGLQARMMSQALRKLCGVCSRTKTTILFTNQIRTKLGMVFGSNEVTSGGNALKFYSSLRIEVRKVGGLTHPKGATFGDALTAPPHGERTRFKVNKNKLSPPFRSAEASLIYGKGFVPEGGV